MCDKKLTEVALTKSIDTEYGLINDKREIIFYIRRDSCRRWQAYTSRNNDSAIENFKSQYRYDLFAELRIAYRKGEINIPTNLGILPE